MITEAKSEYPRTWGQFLDEFGSEETCTSYLERLRWPNGFACPSCGSMTPPYRASRLRLMCKDCRHQSTVTAGTIFEKTRTPLRLWFAAAWYLTNQRHGVSALGLQRVLGLGSYQSAWMMLHRFRCAMVRAGRQRLQGVVEVEEAYVAITDRENTVPRERRKSCTDKVLIGVAVEILQPKGFGRIRLRRLPNDSKECVRQFIQDAIDPGSVVRTVGSGSYAKLHEIGHSHERHVMLGSDVPAPVSMAGRLLQQAVVTDPVTYQDIVESGSAPEKAA